MFGGAKARADMSGFISVDTSGTALFGFEGARLHLENPIGEEMQEKSPCPHESANKGVFTNILGSEQTKTSEDESPSMAQAFGGKEKSSE